ncbi:hypothetical protein FACS1894122_11900 [Alphaproteobacteria bacterium]|nr:hypothetical protein FACS1894122_11900 [Alphaproteobacteria bacterium]
MTEDIESKVSEAESYRAEVLEISKLCKLVHAENKMAEFIEQQLTPDQVKEKLLASVSTQNAIADHDSEIMSTVYHQEKTAENPVISAAKARLGEKWLSKKTKIWAIY